MFYANAVDEDGDGWYIKMYTVYGTGIINATTLTTACDFGNSRYGCTKVPISRPQNKFDIHKLYIRINIIPT